MAEGIGRTERLLGWAEVELTGFDPEAVLNQMAGMGLEFRGLRRPDPYTLRLSVRENLLPRLSALVQRCNGDLRIVKRQGGSRLLRALRRRAVLLSGLGLVTALLLASSLFVWDIRVEGCETLSSGQVLRALSDCGVDSGCFWPGVSVDLLRSRMLLKMPELQWMTVRFQGSRATVLVVERSAPVRLQEGKWADICAKKAGLIRRMSVLRGLAQTASGEMVTPGQLLITGRLESITAPTRTEYALGTVLAETWTELSAVSPIPQQGKGELTGRSSLYALKIGKNRWNILRTGRKTLDGCDTIVHEYKIGVEGLFALPLSLIREDTLSYQTQPLEPDLEEELCAHLLARLEGEVLSAETSGVKTGDLLLFTLRAHCLEDIGQTQEYPAEDSPP